MEDYSTTATLEPDTRTPSQKVHGALRGMWEVRGRQPFDKHEVSRAAARVLRRTEPGFIYNPGGEGSCDYVPRPRDAEDTRPQAITGCFVGEILKELGWTYELLDQNGGTIGHFVAGMQDPPYDTSAGLYSQYFTVRAKVYLIALQAAQDKGSTWELAASVADALADTMMEREDTLLAL